jgi:hypothetical protein
VLTEVHDVVAADGAIVDHDVCAHRTGENEIRTASGSGEIKRTEAGEREREGSRRGSSRRRLPQAQSATAFHFLISRRLPFLQSAPAQEGEGAAGGTATATSPWSIASETYGRRNPRRAERRKRMGGGTPRDRKEESFRVWWRGREGPIKKEERGRPAHRVRGLPKFALSAVS